MLCSPEYCKGITSVKVEDVISIEDNACIPDYYSVRVLRTQIFEDGSKIGPFLGDIVFCGNKQILISVGKAITEKFKSEM